MRKLCFTIIILCALMSCKDKPTSDISEETSNNTTKLTEIITRSYSVVFEDRMPAMDTLSMMQSIIVDENGREMANLYYNLDGTLQWKDVYSHDEEGNKIGSDYYENGEEKSAYYVYELDSLDRIIRSKTYDVANDSLLYELVYKYEEEGRLKKAGFMDENGEFRHNFEYTFTPGGMETGYVYISPSGERYISKYSYRGYEGDEWTLRYVVENGGVTVIEEREFKPFDKDEIINQQQ